MKITDEEKEELKELYNTYKDVKDVESLKLLGGLIRTSKWYKNWQITHSHVWSSLHYKHCELKVIFNHPDYNVYHYRQKVPLIILFLKYLVKFKEPKIYKPI